MLRCTRTPSRLFSLRLMATVLATLAVLAGCATGRNAVATGGNFEFVSPGGQTRILYDPPSARGHVRGLSGDSLLEPGRTIGAEDFAGQVVVLNVWGSWCGPCRVEMPELQQVYQQTRSSGVSFLGVDVRDERAAAADFIRDRAITYPSIFDQASRSLITLSGFPRNTVPSTIVLDREHRVAAVFLTSIRVSELMPVIQRVAADPAAGAP
jgi:thiol-disulfide isomerase/thioredoxin